MKQNSKYGRFLEADRLGMKARVGAAAVVPLVTKRRGLKYRPPASRAQVPAVRLTGKGGFVRGV